MVIGYDVGVNRSCLLPVIAVNCGKLDGVELQWVISRFVSDGATGIPKRDVDRLTINLPKSLGRSIVDVTTGSFKVMAVDLLAQFQRQA